MIRSQWSSRAAARAAIAVLATLAIAAPAGTAALKHAATAIAATQHPLATEAAPAVLLVPARPDSVSIESEPGPLLVPGRSVIPDSLVRTPQKFARVQAERGRQMERLGNLQAAVIAYTNAVRADSLLPGVSGRLGSLQLAMGRPAAAVPALRRELRRSPGDTQASRELGLALSAIGRHHEAIARLKRLSAIEPRNDEAWYALGLAYANAGRLREAEAPLKRSIALPPDRSLEHRDLGVVLGSLSRPREAREEYRRALALTPDDVSIWLNLGNLEARNGHADSAIVAYREAERRDSSYALAYEGELKALTTLDRRDAIADLYMRWVTAAPQDDDLRLRAVRHLADLDRRDRALEVARDGVRFNANSPAKRMVLGLALAAYGSTREAVGELRQAERLSKLPAERDRVRQLIGSMRLGAPDSLRGMFEADSVAHTAKP